MNLNLITTFCLSICFTMLSLFLPVQAQNDGIETVVDKFITLQEKREKAAEYRDARKVVHGDLNRDGKPDVVVLYTLEDFYGGTNLWIQYLAVFINRGNKFVYATHRSVGGKNQRGLSLKSIAISQINLDTEEYLQEDASCCPSGTGHTRFMWRNGKLTEIKKRVAKGKT